MLSGASMPMISASPSTKAVTALQKAGVDVLLMNLQYSPRTETMISVPPYHDNMRVVAQQQDIPLFDRFAIMRHWNEQESSICSARPRVSTLPNVFTTASAARWRNS